MKERYHLLLGILISLCITIIILRGLLFAPGLVAWGDLTFHNDIEVIRGLINSTFNKYSGSDNSGSLHLLPLYSLALITPTTEIFVRMIFVLIFTVMGTSIFFLVFRLVKEKEGVSLFTFLSATLGTVVYVLNPWVVNRVGHFPFLWGYALLPFIFYLVYQVCTNPHRQIVRNSLLISLLLFFAVSSFTMLIMIIIINISLIMFQIGSSYKNHIPLRPIARSLILSSIIVVASFLSLTLFWTMPFFSSYQSAYKEGPPWGSISQTEVNYLSSYASFTNSVRLSSYYASELLFSNKDFNPFWIAFGISIAIVAFASLLERRKYKILTLFAVLALISIVLSSGTKSQLGFIQKWLLLDSPIKGFLFLIGLHDPDRWTIIGAFSYSMMIALFSPYIIKKLSSLSKLQKSRYGIKISAIGVVALVLIGSMANSYPFLSGDLNGYLKPRKLPEEYGLLESWMKDRPGNYSVFWLPEYTQFKWINTGIDPQPALWLSPDSQEVFYHTASDGRRDFIRETEQHIMYPTSYRDILELGRANVKYIVFHNDTVEDFSWMYKFLQNNPYLDKVFEKGALSVFEIKGVSEYISTKSNVVLFSDPYRLGKYYESLGMNRSNYMEIPLKSTNSIRQLINAGVKGDDVIAFLSSEEILPPEILSGLSSSGSYPTLVFPEPKDLSNIAFYVEKEQSLGVALRIQGNAHGVSFLLDGKKISDSLISIDSDGWYHIRAIPINAGQHYIGIITRPVKIFDTSDLLGWTSSGSLRPFLSSVEGQNVNISYEDLPVKWSVIPKDVSTGNRLIFHPKQFLDLRDRQISVGLQIDNVLPQPPEIHIIDDKGRYRFYSIPVKYNGEFQSFTIDVENYAGKSTENMDLSHISQVELRVYAKSPTTLVFEDTTNISHTDDSFPVKWSVIPKDVSTGNRLIFHPKQFLDLRDRQISVGLQIDNVLPQPPEIHIIDDKGRYRFYSIPVKYNGEFQSFTIDVENYAGKSTENMDLSHISQVELRVYAKSPTTLVFNDLFKDSIRGTYVVVHDSKTWLPSLHADEAHGKLHIEDLKTTDTKFALENCSSLAFIEFQQEYSNLWSSGQGGNATSMSVYPAINGFVMPCEEPVQIVYRPQTYFEEGLLMTVAAFLAITTILTITVIIRSNRPPQ